MNVVTNYFKFLGDQLTHAQLPNYCLWFMSFGIQLALLVSNPITPVTVITFIGTNLGVACVSMINATRPINGILGVLSGICFIIAGLSAKNYLSILEQVAYMCTLDLPVIISPSWNDNVASKIRKFDFWTWIKAIGFTLAVWFISSTLIGNFTPDPRPLYDGLAFSISLTGGLVCFLRYNDQYFWWLASGIAQLVLWYITFKQCGATNSMFFNSMIYILNDVIAFVYSPWFNSKTRAKVQAENISLHNE